MKIQRRFAPTGGLFKPESVACFPGMCKATSVIVLPQSNESLSLPCHLLVHFHTNNAISLNSIKRPIFLLSCLLYSNYMEMLGLTEKVFFSSWRILRPLRLLPPPWQGPFPFPT